MPKNARRLPLGAEYHDGHIESVEVGPRREVVITVRLDPVWNDGDDSARRLHFSSIQNFEEVASFFGRCSSAQGGCRDDVLGITLVADGVIGIELTYTGYVEVRGAKVREYRTG
jgi:hypothetical protein